jgi:hypothetical protein
MAIQAEQQRVNVLDFPIMVFGALFDNFDFGGGEVEEGVDAVV